MFEHYKHTLLPFNKFVYRLLRSLLLGAMLVVLFIGIGMLGFHYLEGLCWLESYVEATMFFGGMGTAVPIVTWWGRLFAGTYALLCPFCLVIAISILLTPFLHRFLHKFHIDSEQ